MLPTVDFASPVLFLIIVAVVSCVGLCVALAAVGCLLWLVGRRRPARSPLFAACLPKFQPQPSAPLPVEDFQAHQPLPGRRAR
jgi:hypothetical protein